MNNWIELADFKIARVLSYLGQEYSLGVFLWHNFFQIFITFAMIRFDRFLGFSANHISYILINIMTAVLSLLFIYFVKKHYRLNKFLFNI
jgi:peptidoglycan/LPS O-acetylase OafA/YrhL